MKKKLILVTIALLLQLGLPIKVKAQSVSIVISSVTEISNSNEFTVTIGLRSSSAIGGVEVDVNNDNNLQIINYSVVAGTGSSNKRNNNKIHAALAFQPATNNTNFLKITYKPTASFIAGKKTTISVTNIIAGDASGNRIGATGASRTISFVAPKSSNNNLSTITANGKIVSGFKASTLNYNLGNTDESSIQIGATLADRKARVSGVGKVNLAYGTNNIRLVVTAENGAAKTYTLRIVRNDYRSKNNYLKSLKVSSGNLIFDKERTNYTVIVDHDVKEITIDAEKEDAKATLKNETITKALDVYSNKFEIKVTAENMVTRTYLINVVRRDADGYAGSLNTNNNLKTFEIEGFEFDFLKSNLNYELQVDHEVRELEVLLEVEDEKAGLIKPENFELELGDNTFEIVVIAEDETEKVYTLKVHREKTMTPLNIDMLVERLETIDANQLNVRVNGNEHFDASLLEKLKAEQKPVAFFIYEGNRILGYWLMEPADIHLINTFNKEVKRVQSIPDQMMQEMNFAQALLLEFAHEGDFEKPTTFVVELDQHFDASHLLNLYYVNNDKNRFEKVNADLEQNQGAVMLTLDHASQYVLTPANLDKNTLFDFDLPFDMDYVLLGGLGLLVLSLFGNLFALLRIKKLKKRLMRHHQLGNDLKQE